MKPILISEVIKDDKKEKEKKSNVDMFVDPARQHQKSRDLDSDFGLGPVRTSFGWPAGPVRTLNLSLSFAHAKNCWKNFQHFDDGQ